MRPKGGLFSVVVCHVAYNMRGLCWFRRIASPSDIFSWVVLNHFPLLSSNQLLRSGREAWEVPSVLLWPWFLVSHCQRVKYNPTYIYPHHRFEAAGIDFLMNRGVAPLNVLLFATADNKTWRRQKVYKLMLCHRAFIPLSISADNLTEIFACLHEHVTFFVNLLIHILITL